MTLSVVSIKSEKKESGFDLFNEIVSSIKKNDVVLENGDVLVISSKYISTSEKRLLPLDQIKPSKQAKDISEKFQIKPKIAEIILRESDIVFGGIPGFVITSSDNILAPNAGIDKSNVTIGKIILYPYDPYLIAEQLRRKFFLNFQINIGVIVVDSRLMPARVGTTGVAIACAGIEPLNDMRAQNDLEGNPLKVTFQAVADTLATIANHKMGEGSESKPFAVVKNSGAKLTNRKITPNEMTVSHDLCVYVRGLKSR
jgi:coenzyme F420-0:L-glutamate ligase / coenzyme F420-1:gamma-L-glutamate ligase